MEVSPAATCAGGAIHHIQYTERRIYTYIHWSVPLHLLYDTSGSKGQYIDHSHTLDHGSLQHVVGKDGRGIHSNLNK